MALQRANERLQPLGLRRCSTVTISGHAVTTAFVAAVANNSFASVRKALAILRQCARARRLIRRKPARHVDRRVAESALPPVLSASAARRSNAASKRIVAAGRRDQRLRRLVRRPTPSRRSQPPDRRRQRFRRLGQFAAGGRASRQIAASARRSPSRSDMRAVTCCRAQRGQCRASPSRLGARAPSMLARAPRTQQLGGAALLHHAGNAARRRPPAESAAAATGRRRGWSGSSCRPAHPARGRRAPRAPAHRRRWRRRPISSSRLVAQARSSDAPPIRQLLGDAVGHLRRRRLGEGEAEDALRRRAGQQQAQHAVGQHLGLARAGRGGDPGRRRRVGGAALRRRGAAWSAAATAVAHVSSPSATDHSAIAREMVVVAEARRRIAHRARDR